ncbi:hypothetical protein MNB_SV-5-1303 [hydrothermal vent metagenome]|uniref:Nitrous oxide reductase maturation protein, outer-membrane lipoprotein NosL n=1 Tax=hydrothermal vent metagenome TaxID=652676 RepID=A0A1W1EBM9_9ZZZZ
MKIKAGLISLVLIIASTMVQAEMKCEAGKCGGSMKSDMKNTKAPQNSKDYVYKGNLEAKAIEIKANEYKCSKCNMKVNKLDYVVQVIMENGDTRFFDDMGCVILWLKDHASDKTTILTKTLDTHKWLDAKKVWYSRIAPTPMAYGFAAVENKKDGLINYMEMKELMLQGKNLRNPQVKKSLLEK